MSNITNCSTVDPEFKPGLLTLGQGSVILQHWVSVYLMKSLLIRTDIQPKFPPPSGGKK